MSVLDQLKKLEKQAGKLRAQATREAMAGVKAALATLNSLGHSYKLTKDGPFPMAKGKPKGKGKITRKRDPKKPCPVCGETGHDARRHRWDKKKKKA